MSEMNLRQQEFTYSACELFTKNKERIQTFKEMGHSQYRYIFTNKIKHFFNMTWLIEMLNI